MGTEAGQLSGQGLLCGTGGGSGRGWRFPGGSLSSKALLEIEALS